MEGPRIERAQAGEGGVEVVIEGRVRTFGWRWLRDHGEDPASLDPDTLQRTVDTFAIPADNVGEVTVAPGGGSLEVAWRDGGPPTTCSAALLVAVTEPGRPARHQLWSEPRRAGGEPVPFADLVADDAALGSWLGDAQRWGFARATGIPATLEAAEQLARRIGPPRRTVFGTMWRLAAEMDDHRDSAYSTTFLEPHTDGTYFAEAPALQLFCCAERSGRGGESVIVDGFAVAEELRQRDPAAFEILTTVPVPGRYVEPGVHYLAERPPIRLDRHARLEQVSFNNYDRSPFWLPEPAMSGFYEAYAAMHRLITDRGRWREVRLGAGDGLLVDNWRALHGRLAYTGSRVFHGCYHGRDDYLGRLRLLAPAGVRGPQVVARRRS